VEELQEHAAGELQPVVGAAADVGERPDLAGGNVARQSAIKAGLAVGSTGSVISRACGSGLNAIAAAAHRVIVDRVPMQSDRMKRDHMERTASIKHTFTAEDIYDRARRTLEQSLLHGVTHMRTQVEVDPNVGLLGFEAVSALGERLIGRPALGLGDAKLAGLMGFLGR
jgi:hypothetical protein